VAILEGLTSKLSDITERLRGKSRLTEQDIKDMMREIRLALLEADVNYQVVKEFVADVSEQARGEAVMKSLTPGQMVIKFVNDKLVEILGESESKLNVSPTGFTVIMLYGLQGAGKTTTAAKLANMLKKQGKKPIVTSVDVHRPAAAKQLAVLAEQIDVPCYIRPEEPDAVTIAREAVERGRYLLCDTLIVDTAGRTTIDEVMMDELKAIGEAVRPTERLLIVDAMIGQEAVNVALAFNEAIAIDGFIMTKLDGDARGGAALSIRKMTGIPIKLIATGERVSDFEAFYPERLASRILGMGDVMTLIERAAESIDEEEAKRAYDRLRRNDFTLEDMLQQLGQMKKMGSMQDMLGMIPGMSNRLPDGAIDEQQFDRFRAVIQSMTKKERNNHRLLNASRRKRIAQGSGTQVSDVNQVIRQFEQMQKMMKQFSGKGKGKHLLKKLGLGI
jgi:signal recognition particle subunit SRP54